MIYTQTLENCLILTDLQESLGENRLREDVNSKRREQDQLRQKFNAQLINAIEQTLANLGEPVKNTFFQQLQVEFNLPKKAIPNNVDLFLRFLHKAFGLGATRIEINIIKNLQQKLGLNLELNEYEWPLSRWVIKEFNFKHFVWEAERQMTTKG